jgi:hypothetical protein
MNPYSGIDDNNNIRTKAIAAAIPMAGIIVAAALLSGLSLFSSYPQPAMAQNATSNATTTTTGGGGAQSSSACAPTQTGGGGGGQNATTNATTTGGGGASNATSTTAGEGGNESTSEVRLHIEEACMAAQNGDMQGVLMHLNLALNALDNMTTTAGGGGASNATSTLAGVLTEGGNTTGDGDGEGE